MSDRLTPSIFVEGRAYIFSADGEAWNTSGTPALEAFADANFSDYLLTPTRDGTTHPSWTYTVPATLPAGDYMLRCYDTTTPVVTDEWAAAIAFAWTGSALVLASDIATILTAAASADGKLPADTATKLANLDAAVSSRLATAGYTAPPSAADIRTEIDANSTKLDAAISTRATPADVQAAAPSGDGDTAVNHDTGSPGSLAAKDADGGGLDNVTIRAYLTSEYDANATTATLRAITTTDASGGWVTPMLLNSGLTYTLVYSRPDLNTSTQEVTVS